MLLKSQVRVQNCIWVHSYQDKNERSHPESIIVCSIRITDDKVAGFLIVQPSSLGSQKSQINISNPESEIGRNY